MMNRIVLFLLLALAPVMAVNAQTAKEIYKQGKELYDAKKYEQALPLLRTAAEKGHKKAQYRLGRCYDKGHAVGKNKATAFQWYLKSARQDYAKAQYQVAKAYLKGTVVTADEHKAKSWMKKAVSNPKDGEEVLAKVKKDAAEGHDTAKRLLTLIGK